ncbi:Uracil phosphoribosyltransferase, synthesizes UMP from uracil, partial [Lobosporangium transversale]
LNHLPVIEKTVITPTATGGSAIKAIETLIDHGVPEERILFLNLICCPQGINAVVAKFPTLKIVTAEIDVGLDEKLYIDPGLGDFGCRYFGTDK